MTNDSAIPDLKLNSPANVEAISALSDVEENPVLPDAEVETVLLYLKDNSAVSDVELTDSPSPENTVNNNIPVQFKSDSERLLLILPTESQVPASEHNWSEIWQQMKLRLNALDRFFSPNTIVHLVAQDRLLDGRQLQELAETLTQAQIQLKSVSTSRRQTAIAAAASGYSVEQLQLQTTLHSESKAVISPLAEALYLEMTVRSGVEIRHPGTVIILGDLNPGGIVVADGDILVWGRLRGIAHAGAAGNRECLIMALQMKPTQLRIADAVARAPEKAPMEFYPEVAYTTSQGIRIARATDFSRTLLSRMNQEP